MGSVFYYIALFLVSLISTMWVYKKTLRIAIDKNIVDNPDARKIQRVPVPVLGGVAVYFGIVVALSFAGLFSQEVSALFEIGAVMTIMLFIGTIDDIISLSPKFRFFVEILAVLLLVFCNHYSINDFHGLWGVNQIPTWFSIPLTVFACVGIINAINLIDGVNGLSSGYCIFACAIFGYVFYRMGDVSRATLAFVAIGALIPFFLHNVFGQKSKMFIGDGGTLLMGVIMSSFVINVLKSGSLVSLSVRENFGLVPFTLAVFAIPVFDTIRVMTLRILRGISPFSPDKTHLHHLLLDLHFSHIGTSALEILSNILIVVVWWASYKLGASVDIQLYIVILLGLLVTFAFYKFARVQERKASKIHSLMVRFGDRTHVGSKEWFDGMRKMLDKNID